MDTYLLPMFPLGTPLVPGALLPLQIFEQRYQLMMSDVLAASEPEFGVVLIERGHEVGGGDIRSMVGTVARIVDSQLLADGRRMVIALGTRRMRVDEWLADVEYPVAMVSDWPDDPHENVEAAELVRMFDHLIEVSRLVERLGGPIPRFDSVELSDDPTFASFQLVALAPIGPADRQRMLNCDGPVRRIQLLEESLGDVEAACQFRLQED